MSEKMKCISLSKFKAFNKNQKIQLSDINIFMGANSSGKSSCIQGLLALKQTYESKQSQIGLLLSGKYATLGSFKDVINSNSNSESDLFSIGLCLESKNSKEEINDQLEIMWEFCENANLINGVQLKRLEIKSQKKIIHLILNDVKEHSHNHEYNLFIDKVLQPQTITLNNLFIDKITTPYDKDYNSNLVSFLKEVLEWLSEKKIKQISLEKNKPVISQLSDLNALLDIIETDVKKMKSHNKKTKAMFSQEEIFEISDKINKKIKLQAEEINVNEDISEFFIVQLWMILMKKNLDKKEFELIWEKYKNVKPRRNNEDISKITLPLNHFIMRNNKKEEENLHLLFKLYNELCKKELESIRYLGPMREMPKSLYKWNIDVDPEYVGSKGEYFPSVLTTIGLKEIETILPGEENSGKETLEDALNSWCEYLDVATEINISSKNSFGMNISVNKSYNASVDIVNVGVGTSQVLPVLIMGLVSPQNSIIIYEQPELHLHPYSQSRLADFFVAMSKLGKQFIIETHSEYMLHRFRYHLLKKELKETNIKVNFFDYKPSGTLVYEGFLNKNGGIEYPNNFVDQNQSLFLEMLQLDKEC